MLNRLSGLWQQAADGKVVDDTLNLFHIVLQGVEPAMRESEQGREIKSHAGAIGDGPLRLSSLFPQIVVLEI